MHIFQTIQKHYRSLLFRKARKNYLLLLARDQAHPSWSPGPRLRRHTSGASPGRVKFTSMTILHYFVRIYLAINSFTYKDLNYKRVDVMQVKITVHNHITDRKKMVLSVRHLFRLPVKGNNHGNFDRCSAIDF